MKARALGWLIWLVAGLLVACQTEPNQSSVTATVELATRTPTVTALPQPTAAPSLTPTPTPELRQLTSGGCCVMPGWSPDSRQVLFVDKPSADDPVGVYALDVTGGPASKPQFAGAVGIYSDDRSLIAFPDGAKTVVEKLTTGESWVMPNNGQAVSFAPDDKHLAWEQEAISGPYDQRQNNIYLANIDGTDSGRIARVYGGGLVGWLPQGLNVVFVGRPSLDTHDQTLTVLDLHANVAIDLAKAERISGVGLSTRGSWIAYFISFNDDKARNGVWVQRTDGTQPRRLDLWGAYQWRDDSHLLVIPARESTDKAFEVWEIDAASGESRQLTDGSVTPLNILNGDWRVSPDGQSIVFVNSIDRNLWLLKLPIPNE